MNILRIKMGAGILPIAITKYAGTTNLYILLGQERNNEKWSDFGGGSHKGEKPIQTAIREGGEELNGLLGLDDNLEDQVKNNKVLTISYDKYTSYVFRTKYNKDLPKYFNNNNIFAEKYLNDKVNVNHNGLFEKKRIGWFPIIKFSNNRTKSIIRPHYLPFIDNILKNKDFIIDQIEKIDKKKEEIIAN